MSARDQELIARLERIRSLSLKDIGERFFFLFWPWGPRVGGEVQNVC